MENSESGSTAKALSWWKEILITTGVPIVFVLFFVTVGGFGHGKPMVEKMLRGFILPCGLLWLTLLMIATWCFVRRQRSIGSVAMFAFLAHAFFGGEVSSMWLCELLEGPYEFVSPADSEEFDVVVVLGGGTKSGSPDHAALSFAGDRIALAVRIFHAGKTDTLVFTGSKMDWEESVLSPFETSRKLAIELMVPESAIEVTPGHNTYEEFQYLKDKYSAVPTTRIGLITSATHMSRAMRLAETVGVSMIPIPADFERRMQSPTLLSLIPAAAGYRMAERACVEFLARLVGR